MVEAVVEAGEVVAAVDTERQRLPAVDEAELREGEGPLLVPVIGVLVEDVEAADRQREVVADRRRERDVGQPLAAPFPAPGLCGRRKGAFEDRVELGCRAIPRGGVLVEEVS